MAIRRIAIRVGASLLRRGFKSAIDAGIGMGVPGEAADEAFMLALDMCGNNGQVSIIEMTGYEAFYEAALDALGGNAAEWTLINYCPYPDAVGEILGEAGALIDEYLAEAAGQEFLPGWEGYGV